MRRRDFLKISASLAAAKALARNPLFAETPPDYKLQIAHLDWELAPKKTVKTTAYNGQIPGPLLRMREGQSVAIDVTNALEWEEIVHWHGLWLPVSADGAMEEASPMIAPGATQRVQFTARPAGSRWYHTHGFAGHNLKRGLYSGMFGFLMVDPRQDVGRYDREFFLALHDWEPALEGSDDGSMNPVYRYASINGKLLGAGDPLRVKQGERVLLHFLNASPTEEHWLALSGHTMQVIALDGNPVPRPLPVRMLRISPGERVCAVVSMDAPGSWVLGEVRKHVQAAGMGILVEYAGHSGKPQWQQPEALDAWDYAMFGDATPRALSTEAVETIPLVFQSKFKGHGDMDYWTINGKSYPETEVPKLREGQRYRLLFDNQSTDDHPVHMHRHTWELRSQQGNVTSGVRKDVVVVPARTKTEVDFVANNPGGIVPGDTLFHCHQQDHMDLGFMMLFRYAADEGKQS
jgi:FtsP/CotA-like multicopper oxidase with cupredoxin domain